MSSATSNQVSRPSPYPPKRGGMRMRAIPAPSMSATDSSGNRRASSAASARLRKRDASARTRSMISCLDCMGGGEGGMLRSCRLGASPRRPAPVERARVYVPRRAPRRAETGLPSGAPQRRRKLERLVGQDGGLFLVGRGRLHRHGVLARDDMDVQMKDDLTAGRFVELLQREAVGVEYLHGGGGDLLHDPHEVGEIVRLDVEKVARG